MEHIIKLISEYAGDIEQRDSRIRELEGKTEQLQSNLERCDNSLRKMQDIYEEGYASYEVDLICGFDRSFY